MAEERGPHVLIAVVTGDGLRRADDGRSFIVEGIGNAISVSSETLGPGGTFAIPLYVMAVAGRSGQSVRLGIAVDYPDGQREVFPFMADASKKSASDGGPMEWHRILTLVYRMPGQHWIRISLNGSIKTEIPLNVTLDETGGSGVRFDA